MIKYLVTLLCASLLLSCLERNETVESLKHQKIKLLLDSLASNQAVIRLNINNTSFYPDSNYFSGNGIIDERGIKISLKDQNFGNVIVNIEGDNWFKTKPYRIELKDGYPIGSNMGSFLVGKMTSLDQNKGEGYLLSDGFFEVNYISKNIFVVNVKGNLKQPFGNSPLSPIDGYIVWNVPGYTLKADKNFEIPFLNEK